MNYLLVRLKSLLLGSPLLTDTDTGGSLVKGYLVKGAQTPQGGCQHMG